MMSRRAGNRASGRNALVTALAEAARHVTVRGVLYHNALAERLGLNASDLQCLAVLQETGPVTAGELATRTALTTGGVTRVVDRLERAGLVERRPDLADRRRVVIVAVPDRQREVAKLYGSVSRAWSELLADYDDEQLELFLDLFTRMCELSDAQIADLARGRRDLKSGSAGGKVRRVGNNDRVQPGRGKGVGPCGGWPCGAVRGHEMDDGRLRRIRSGSPGCVLGRTARP